MSLLTHPPQPPSPVSVPPPHHQPWLVSPAHSPSNPFFFTSLTEPFSPLPTSLASAFFPTTQPPPPLSPFPLSPAPPPFLPAPVAVEDALFEGPRLKKIKLSISPPSGIFFCLFLRVFLFFFPLFLVFSVNFDWWD